MGRHRLSADWLIRDLPGGSFRYTLTFKPPLPVGVSSYRKEKETSMTLLDIRSWADVRAFLHVALPGLSVLLVALHYVTQGDATLWGALAAVLIQVGLSTFNSASGFRTFLYPFLGAVGALLVRYGLTTADTWGVWLGFVPILFGGGVAAANTDTSPASGE